jgi:hypothetical protein
MRRKYDHRAEPDPISRGSDGNTERVLCRECYAPIHAYWTYVGSGRQFPDMRWRHSPRW